MHPLIHFIASAILAAVLFPFFGYFSLLALLSGVLIDIDHYLLYIIQKKDFNLINCYKYCSDMVPHFTGSMFILHTIELIALFSILSVFYNQLIPLVAGLALHNIMDFINEKFSPIYELKPYSLILYLIRKYS